MANSFAVGQTSAAPAIRVGDVLSRSLALFSSRLASFTALALVAFAPEFLFDLLVPNRANALRAMGLIVLKLACSALANASILYGVVQELRGRGFTFSESLNAGFGRMGAVVGVSLLVGLFAGLAALLLVIPGFIVWTVYAIAVPVCVAERMGVLASMSRSAFLTKGNRWRIFGILFLNFVVLVVIGGLIGFFGARIGGMTMVTILQYPLEAIAGAFNAVALGVLYYQLRVAKEGVDIEKIASVFD
jgi:hypothetical protein